MKTFWKNTLKTLILIFLWFALNFIDFYSLELNFNNDPALLGRILMASVDVLVLMLLLPHCRLRGLRLIGVLFTALFGVKIFLTAIESVYLPSLAPIASQITLNGLIASLVFSTAAVFILELFDSPPVAEHAVSRTSMNWYHWIWKIPLSSFIWMILFALFGALVFLNIANALDPAALSAYSNLDMPVWVLPFQGFRAMLWLFLVLPLFAQLEGPKKVLIWKVGLVMACWMSSNLLMANQLPFGLQIAHLLEVFGESFVFGLWLVLAFVNRQTFLGANTAHADCCK